MSNYATLQNLKDRLGSAVYPRLTDRAAMTTANDVVGQELVDLAEGKVDGYLAQRFKTPVVVSGDTSLAATMRDFALSIAAWLAYTNHPVMKQVPDAVKGAYDAAIALLVRIADGKAGLPGAVVLESPVSGGSGGTAVGHALVFSEDALGSI